jgi:tRNA(fMet)-specific endonuclease VapC
MILLDTDHITALAFPEHSQFASLKERIGSSNGQAVGVTVINIEEPLRGWLAEINRRRKVHDQIIPYDRLAKLIKFFAYFPILGFDERAAAEFSRLRKQKIRIGTMDLKIAAIALVNDALLLSANLRDFRQVPGLRVENWLE